MLFSPAIKEDLGMTTKNGHHHVLPAVVVQITECGPAAYHRGAYSGIHPFETSVMIYRQQRKLFIVQRWVDRLYVIQNMSLGDKQIFPSVVVEILQAYAPPRAPAGEDAQAGLQALIAERAFPLVVVHAVDLARQLGHDDVGPSVVVVVLKNHSHARKPSTVLGESCSRRDRKS